MSSEKYAGFWLRFVAYLIDTILVNILKSFIILPFLALFGISLAGFSGFDFAGMDEKDIVTMVLAFIGTMGTAILISYVVEVLYFSIMESSKHQATLGKLAMGLIVTDLNGNALEFPRAFLRNISKIFSGMFFMIGYIMAGFTEKKQALHDLIASVLITKR